MTWIGTKQCVTSFTTIPELLKCSCNNKKRKTRKNQTTKLKQESNIYFDK